MIAICDICSHTNVLRQPQSKLIHEWERAEAIARLIEQRKAKAQALGEMEEAFSTAQQNERPDTLWADAEVLAFTITEEVE